jgi:transcriptional regulator with XRE-family HTH domain
MRATAGAYLRYIAANVRRLRVKKNWTQEQLAEHASVEPRYVHSMEAARANPTVKVLVAVAEAFGVPPMALFRPAKFSKAPPGRPRRSTRR